MNKLRETLRLHFECGLSNRQIARALKLSPTTVGYYVDAAKQAGLDWQSITRLRDTDVSKLLEPYCKQLSRTSCRKATIALAYIHSQLKKKGITRQLLHEEYQQSCKVGEAVSYTEFCRQYREYKKTLKSSLRQTHVAGEKAFVDYAGPTVPIYQAKTGNYIEAVIFVGVLGASNFTFAEATLTRSLPDWLGSHVRMYHYFGGVPQFTIPDNEKAAVNKACQYDPELNPHYAALAAHYQTVILPTRPYHPKDKAKVEVAVQIVERWILARLRQQKFFSLTQLNQAIAKLLEQLNHKPFKKLPGNRRQYYETLDKPALKPLPTMPYEFVEIKKAQVNLDYHVEIGKHFYSVPHHYIGKRVDCQAGKNTVAIFYQGQRIATHPRCEDVGKATTVKAHMPQAHRQHQQWSPKQFVQWSSQIGSAMKKMATYLLKHKPHPECCYRIHLGFLSLAKKFGEQRLEEACFYACQHHLFSYTHVKSILQTHCDKAPCGSITDEACPIPITSHTHLRGANYYSTQPKGEKL